MEQIACEGNYPKPNDQMNIPEDALLDTTAAAKTSLLLTPYDMVSAQSFTNIKQSVDESFIKFIYHLKVAWERQIESKEARKEMLVKMATTNANSMTKTILRSLPLNPEPTID